MRLFKSFYYALQGLGYCFRREANFRIHSFAALFVVMAAKFFKVNSIEWVLLILCIALVMSAEMINTAIEKACDLWQKEFHPHVKIIKDVAAGGVLVTAILSCICGGIIFLPKILFLFQNYFNRS